MCGRKCFIFETGKIIEITDHEPRACRLNGCRRQTTDYRNRFSIKRSVLTLI